MPPCPAVARTIGDKGNDADYTINLPAMHDKSSCPAHHADPDVDRPPGYAYSCAQITRFGTAFSWNHDELMRAGEEGPARRLGVAPVLPGTPAQRHRPDRNARWVVVAAVLTTLAALGWRRHASSR